MKQTHKRLSALLLAACLALSMMLPAVSAETAKEPKTAVYNLEYQTAVDELSTELKDGGNGLYKNGVLSEKIVGNMNTYYAGTEYGALNWKYAAMQMSGNVEFDTGYSMMASSQVGDWIALWIKSPGAGTYNVSLTYYGTTSGASESQVYIMPMAADTQDLEAAILAGMTEANLVNKDQTVSFCDSNGSSEKPSKNGAKAGYEAVTTKIGTLTDDGSVTDYILVLKATAQTTTESKQPNAYMYPVKLTLAEGEIEEEEEEAPTLVGYEIVAEDAVKSATCSVATTSVVNGHDYMYMFMRGSVLLVYDLDTKELVDVKTNAFSTPRCATVDSKGIVWGGGAGNYLYRYDPIAKTGEQISFSSDLFPDISSFNLLGLSVDENDNLYFGTYNTGYLGMYDQKTGQFSRISEWLNASETLAPDAMYAGWGGVIVKDGYIYASVDGDKNNDDVATHQIIKYSIAEQKIVHHLDLTEHWGTGGTYLKYMNLVGDHYLLAGSDSMLSKTIAVDISGEEMQFVTLEGDMDVGYSGYVSGEIDGKVYCLGNTKMGDGMFEIDLETMTVTELDKEAFPADSVKLICWSDSLVTIEGDDRLPGTSLVTYRNNTENGTVEPIFYNLQTMETVVWEEFTKGQGNGNQLQCVITDGTRENIYMGAYGFNHVSVYNVESGKLVDQFATYDHQTDSLLFYKGYLYAGNYSMCTINQIDPVTKETNPLFVMKDTAFEQYRCFALIAGEDKVFMGTVPYSNMLGGCLIWYDLDSKLTYVAAGPNPEDVYWTDTSIGRGNYVWHRATTGEVMDFDEDDDGTQDSFITVDGKKVQRFNGLIEKQCINDMYYKDGYIYGTTTVHGGSGSSPAEGNAKLFVYDVKAMKVIATHDLANSIEGMEGQIQWVDTIIEDPAVEGKFWGVVANTLFSCTFDMETATFTVNEELSFNKKTYTASGSNWYGRNILFDGNYIYAVFPSVGTFMIDRNDPQNYTQLSEAIPKRMAMGADGNLYYMFKDVDLFRLSIAEIAQPKVAASVQAMIDALPDTVTQADDAVVAGVRRTYDALIEETKKQVDITKLLAAEAVLAPYRAAQVQAQINAIGTVTLESGDAIREAREAYDALLEAEKALVTNLNVLTAAEAQYAALKDQAVAEVVVEQIKAIGTVTLESEAAITAARAAYEALTDSQKAYVTNLSVLTAAEARYAALKDQAAAEVVVEQIKAIGTVTLESEASITAARAAYDALTDSQKAYVTNLSTLTAAEGTLEALQNPKTGERMPMLALAGLLAISAMAAAALVIDTRKKYI